jgi:ParB family chromosome partitioning protein
MTDSRAILGRGLFHLLGDARTPPRPIAAGADNPTSSAATEELASLAVDLLQRGRYQPRTDMRPESLQELADSIKAQGIVQPIVVRPLEGIEPGKSPRYEILAGERRWRAAQMAGLTAIPAVIRRVPDHAAIAISLVENIQRENLNPIEEARSLQRLITEFRLTHQEAGTAIGRSRVGVSNMLRLLELVPEVSNLLETRQIEMGHARALLALTDPVQQARLASLIVKQHLSVRETEALVRREANSRSSGDALASVAADARMERLAQESKREFGTKITIQQLAHGRCRLVATYESVEELEAVLETLRSRHVESERH